MATLEQAPAEKTFHPETLNIVAKDFAEQKAEYANFDGSNHGRLGGKSTAELLDQHPSKLAELAAGKPEVAAAVAAEPKLLGTGAADVAAPDFAKFVKELDDEGKKGFVAQVSSVVKAKGGNIEEKIKAANLSADLKPDHVAAVKHAAGLAVESDKKGFEEFTKAAGLDAEAFKTSIKTIVDEIKPKFSEDMAKLLKEAGPDKIKTALEFEKSSKFRKMIGSHRYASPAIAGVATLATLAIPNKQEEVTQPDGTTTTEDHWGTGKKVAFTAGAATTVGTVIGGSHWSKYLKIAEAETAKAAQHVR